MDRDSVVGIATRYGLEEPGIYSRWGAIFPTLFSTVPGAHPAFCTMVYRVSFSGIKRPQCGVDHPPLSTVKLKAREQLKLYLRSGPSWPVLG